MFEYVMYLFMLQAYAENGVSKSWRGGGGGPNLALLEEASCLLSVTSQPFFCRVHTKGLMRQQALLRAVLGRCSGLIGNRPNTVSASTVSNTELSEFLGPHRVLGRELSEFLSASYLCAKANSPSFHRTHRVCPKTQ